VNPETQALIDAALKHARNPYQLADMPPWFEAYRDGQIKAINQIMAAYSRGVRMVVLDAPTGSGKTLIGETVRRLLGGTALYVCNNKTLQDQFSGDYPYASVMKGRSNYPTWGGGEKITADDCTWSKERPCSWCPFKSVCPYEVAKQKAIHNRISVLNTAYLMAEFQGPGRFAGRDVVILDEADTLESSVMSHVGLEISRRRVAELELGEPKKVTVEGEWIEWVDEAIRTVDRVMPVLHEGETDVQPIRNYNYLSRLSMSLRSLRKSLDDGGWVYTGKNGQVSFKPVRVNEVSPLVLWPTGKRFLLMSATMISAEAELDWHGWDAPYEFIQMDSEFPVENRRVKVVSCANMSKKVWEVDKLCDGISRVLDRHPDERVLVHTVSYDLAKEVSGYLKRSGRRPVSTYNQAVDRERALSSFKRTRGGVLVASSMDRGVDLPDDLCRVVVVAKVPFPNLGDRQISARLYRTPGGQTWYNIQAVRTLVQMTGRATRHSTDFSTSYILDSQFERMLWTKCRPLFPAWWVEALDWRDRLS
jgi:ATP-dependent DNA helicase DinG